MTRPPGIPAIKAAQDDWAHDEDQKAIPGNHSGRSGIQRLDLPQFSEMSLDAVADFVGKIEGQIDGIVGLLKHGLHGYVQMI